MALRYLFSIECQVCIQEGTSKLQLKNDIMQEMTTYWIACSFKKHNHII